MPAKADAYREKLKTLKGWDALLLKESGLPGPRGNLELAQAVADEGSRAQFEHFLTFTPERAPTNTPGEFVAFCGVVGLGRLAAEGDTRLMPRLRGYASDPRWRLREAVAMALQRVGDADMDRMLREAEAWSTGTWLEQRAAAAGIAEPRLLTNPKHASRALRILDTITSAIAKSGDRKSDEFKALRKGMGYCWSVVVAALPAQGKKAMEKWLASQDKDVRWIMLENLKKNRLVKMDAAWVKRWQTKS
jgi:hypothetical protein